MKLNASDISAWRYCPRDLYYKLVEKREKPQTEHLVKGTLIHLLYKDFFDRKLFSDPPYFKWYLEKGIDRAMEKEDGRINKLGMKREILKNFLLNSLKKMEKAFQDGELTIPIATEQRIENDDFVARADALFEENGETAVADVKKSLRRLDEVKLQLAVAAIILESGGKKVTKGFAIDAESWKQFPVDLDYELKQEVMDIRSKILQMIETKEKPACTCGRCELIEMQFVQDENSG